LRKTNEELFDMETGKYMANLALHVNLIEKRIKKNSSSLVVLDFYNKIYQLSKQFKDDINELEKNIEKELKSK